MAFICLFISFFTVQSWDFVFRHTNVRELFKWKSHRPSPSNMYENDDWRERIEREGENGERGVKAFCSGAPAAPHIFHFPPSWKDQVIEKETIQQPRLHRCQWKASEILEYYTLGNAFVFLSHGAYGGEEEGGRKWLYNDNTWKVFPPSGSCIIVSAQMKPYCFSLDGWCQKSDGGLKRDKKKSGTGRRRRAQM